ncbi:MULTISPECIES: uroporphyrinogen-III C-methyltransferase [unclassified Brenneria]|uniref:uroporphyrinogen-III C-methyltransferase n=1 Tax=unclassified Brenneria TaxID=2634434 RepID=UPI0018F0728C|nr:uroporphyrinogen-III C-methyltransferase [Brenneria sp. L3-3C-1]MBJ7221583.1 uroporphyrinogen-III C-methyltransferase [Brenneria sp. L3-3C-1]MEE3642825.1 uroporphyrinogen-III C-methyltransferase [Brenneria sp. L3_3C_1]
MNNGKVWLVGAGPGDATLITVKGLHCIRHADVLVYDRLVSSDLLVEAPADCEMINVGKMPDHHPVPQPQINQTLVECAQRGLNVVRLKGGDPYVFGRGGEEAEALALSGIAFEVVPGITSAIGGLAYAGIPVTHRDFSSGFHVITGHLRQGNQPQDWAALAKLDGTLVILMGMAQLSAICQQLIAGGKSPATPAAVVMYASRQQQRTVSGMLATLADEATAAGLSSPALIVIGDVVRLQSVLSFTPEPLTLAAVSSLMLC